MIVKYIISLSIVLIFVFSVAAQSWKLTGKVQAINIENIKIQDGEMRNNFLLFQENLFKPNMQATGQIRQCWKRESEGSDLKMTEEETMDLGESVGASCTQKWYRGEKKEKIEVDIIICPSENEIDKTVETFTRRMYSLHYIRADIPFAGDTSWVANNQDNESDSFSVMFLKANVFVRIYVNLKDEKNNGLEVTAKSLANNILNKILSELE
jgi:hypothetical protein